MCICSSLLRTAGVPGACLCHGFVGRTRTVGVLGFRQTAPRQWRREARKTSSVGNNVADEGRNIEDQRRSLVASAKLTLQERYRMANLKTAAMLFVVTTVFVITFVPASLMTFRLVQYHIFVFYLYFVNHVANPFIYSFMNKNFRDQLQPLFCRRSGHASYQFSREQQTATRSRNGVTSRRPCCACCRRVADSTDQQNAHY